MIYQYQQATDAFTTHRLVVPDGSTELATIEDVTYVHVPDGADLPAEQPAEIAASIQPVTLTADLRRAIEDASPHVALIRARVAEKIAEQYSIGDEIKLLRTAPSAEFELYNAFVEDCRAWGRAQKAQLGLR
ncbi:MAG: hypothetical protein KGZ68_12595 [Dechloromonas sp.]|nr:hypothetical protein [Dechloromonas sp.]